MGAVFFYMWWRNRAIFGKNCLRVADRGWMDKSRFVGRIRGGVVDRRSVKAILEKEARRNG